MGKLTKLTPPTFDPESGTILEIINSGKSSIISSKDLRKSISSWDSDINEVKELESRFTEFYFNRKKPYLSKYLPYRNNRKNVFGKSKYAIDNNAIFFSLEFENMVHESWVNSVHLELRYKILQGKIIEMLSILETEINNY